MNNYIKIYLDILNCNIKRFPRKFWINNGKEKSIVIFKYLLENILNYNNNTIFNINYDIISKYKLTSPYSKYFNCCVGTLIKNIYPDLIKGKHIPVSDKTKEKLSYAQKHLSKYKREKINQGIRNKKNNKEYIQKLSITKQGENNPKHKLTENQVKQIKKLWNTKIYSTTTLGYKFNISRSSIADIVYNRTWKHIK